MKSSFRAIAACAFNLKRAEQHRAAVMHAIATGSFDYAKTFPNSLKARKFALQPGDVEKLEGYLETWLEGMRKHLKSSTYNGYRKVVYGRLIPWFGELSLSDFARKSMKDKLKDLNATNKTLANIQSVMRKALDDAVDDELIESNPLAGWCYSVVEPPRESDDIDPFTKDEQAAILAQLKGQGANLIKFAFWTGLRTSELVALNWSDVDFRWCPQ